MSEQDDATRYTVVINHEEQYSIWPTTLLLPAGWTEVGVVGDKQACLDHIDRTWTDMRPLSLRRHMDGVQAAEELPA